MGGVVVNDNRILVLQRSASESVLPGLWELPSGKREFLEPSMEALRREVLEETGLNTKPIQPVSVFDYSIEKENEIRDTTQINFLVILTDDKSIVKISDEHQAYKWISEHEIDSVPVSDDTKITLKKAFRLKDLVK